MKLFLAVVSIIMIISVFLSLVRRDFWVYKIMEYPRVQKLVVLLAITGCWFLIWPVNELFYLVLIGCLFVSIIYLCYKVFPYTPIAKKQMLRVKSADPRSELRIFSANVLQDNDQYDRMLQQIEATDPDLIFLLETNNAWATAMAGLSKKYPYGLAAPLENTYGLLFFSRLKLKNEKVVYLVKNDLPSIDAMVVLPSGQEIQVWGLHPEPPTPTESLYSTAKDKELMKVALKAKEYKGPCVVFGDLNDVAWSHTTELFRKTSELLDPRRGRGFYSTFSAHNWFIRFPLDYIFCSKEFALVTMGRLPKNGSDHFATFSHLALRKDLIEVQEQPEASPAELEEARETAAQPVPQ